MAHTNDLPTITPRQYDTTDFYLTTEPNSTRIAGHWGEEARPRLRNHQRIDTPACSDPDALAKDSTLRPLFMLVFVLLAALLCESPLAMGEC